MRLGVFTVYRASRPTIAVVGKVPETKDWYGDIGCYPENTTVDGVVILRVQAGLYADTTLVPARGPGRARAGAGRELYRTVTAAVEASSAALQPVR